MTYTKATITIQDFGENVDKFWFKDQDGNSYSSFKAWQGTPKDVWTQWQTGNHNGPFMNGVTANISFSKTVGKDDKIYFNLASIFPAIDQTPLPAQKPVSVAPSASNENVAESREAYGKRLAVHGLINGILASGTLPQEVDIAQVFLLEQKINEYLAKPESMVIAEAKIKKPTPYNFNRSDEIASQEYMKEYVEQEATDIDVADIPF